MFDTALKEMGSPRSPVAWRRRKKSRRLRRLLWFAGCAVAGLIAVSLIWEVLYRTRR